jgi:hypothetical protein
MLKVINYIKEHGLEKTLEDFKLKSKDYPHKVLIKYNQIDSDMFLTEVQESRGIILEKDTWNIMSMSFMKFFNSAEGHAAKIDWDSASILEKLDGSLITLYYDWALDKWCAATTGTAEAEGEVNNKMGTTFSDLFFKVLSDTTNIDLNILPKGYSYMFELCTPYNIVVKPHNISSITLLAIRKLDDLTEIEYGTLRKISKLLGVQLVKSFDINAKNSGHVIKTLEGMPYTEEGYVIVDTNFNRIKIKNPAYVAVHHLKSKTAEYNIVEIIKSNEVDEFSATFPDRKSEILKLRDNFYKLESALVLVWDIIGNHLPKNITKEEKKKFALKVFEISEAYGVKSHTGLFFGLNDGKIKDVRDYLMKMDNKKLYSIL